MLTQFATPRQVGWLKRFILCIELTNELLCKLDKMENKLSQLDTDVTALTAGIVTLTEAVNTAIAALQGIVDTSADQAAIEAANAAIADLTAKLAAAVPTPPAG